MTAFTALAILCSGRRQRARTALQKPDRLQTSTTSTGPEKTWDSPLLGRIAAARTFVSWKHVAVHDPVEFEGLRENFL